MKSDRDKAVMWPEEHRGIARYVYLCIAVMGLVVTAMDIMSATAALAASMLCIVYVSLLTRHYTRADPKRQ